MKLFKYNQFVTDQPLNENLDKSKKFLKEQELIKQAATDLDLIQGSLKDELEHREKIGLSLLDFDGNPELRKKMSEIKLSEVQIKDLDTKIAKLPVNAKDPKVVESLEKLKRGESAAAKLRTLFEAENTLGWLYNFVYMFYMEKQTTMSEEAWYDEIIKLYRRCQSYGQLLDRLPKKFDLNFIDVNKKNNAEILVDGLDNLDDYKKIKKMIDTLPSKLKSEYNRAPELIKTQMDEIARGFDEVAAEKKEAVWKTFFGELKLDTRQTLQDGRPNPTYNKMVYSSSLRRFETMDQPLREFIKAAQNHLRASENSDIIAFYDKINKCNEKFGIQGADIVFDEAGILVIEVKSFQANQFLNSHTRHCIKDSMSQWDSYVASKNNKQYYIYNFNLPQLGSGSNLSVIGVTIAPYSRAGANHCNSDKTAEIYYSGHGLACHAKDDGRFADQLKPKLKEWQSEYGIEKDIFDVALKAMTKEEITKRERAIVANREIIKKGLSIEQIKQYVTIDGANINKDNAKALDNAVEEGDLAKTRLCLELGASPNLKKGPEAPISKAKNLEMIKTLVEFGSDMTGDVFNNIVGNLEGLEYCLKAGLDPNFNTFLPFRKCVKGTWKSINDNGESFFEAFKLLLKYGGKLTDDKGRNTIIKWAAEYGRIEILEYLKEIGIAKTFSNSDWKESIIWMSHSRKMTPEKNKKVVEYLQSQIKEEK